MAASRLFQFKSFISYWLDSVDEHSLHSPFFYDFYHHIIRRKTKPNESFESLREKLLEDKRELVITDLGTGKNRRRTVSEIARTSLSPCRLSKLYSAVIGKYKHQQIIELGTSLGVNTLYLAGNPGTNVITFEGSESIAGIAEDTFTFSRLTNISLVRGNIDNTLPLVLQTTRKVDFALIDANHSHAATRRYFNQLLQCAHESTVIVVDDINYSEEMRLAWNEMKEHKLVYGTIDLYRVGLVFFDPSLNKQHVILQFNH